MDTTHSLSPAAVRSLDRWHLLGALALLALLLLLPLLFGIGPNSWRTCAAEGAATMAAPAVVAPTVAEPAASVAPAAPAAAVTPAAEVAPAVADVPPAARVYFALDRTEAPADASTTMAAVIAYLKAHPSAKALVSGFHDPRGDVAHNQELALNRARTVRALLESAGIARDRVVMDKPQETTGTGSNEEARRVEVRVQP
ncbi:OmpA family protein [Luteitalea sp.]|jgi:K(+)-stimulated pyrophosphate-energized sodium pump|uniref:OmpA family protein n=1 Tax=Luteitalea sp. TaxID=2004800 RepID=UPI0037C6F7AB